MDFQSSGRRSRALIDDLAAFLRMQADTAGNGDMLQALGTSFGCLAAPATRPRDMPPATAGSIHEATRAAVKRFATRPLRDMTQLGPVGRAMQRDANRASAASRAGCDLIRGEPCRSQLEDVVLCRRQLGHRRDDVCLHSPNVELSRVTRDRRVIVLQRGEERAGAGEAQTKRDRAVLRNARDVRPLARVSYEVGRRDIPGTRPLPKPMTTNSTPIVGMATNAHGMMLRLRSRNASPGFAGSKYAV